MLLKLVQLYFLTLPFQFALSPVEGVDLHVSRVFAIGVFLLWLGRSLHMKRVVVPNHPIVLLFVSFLLFAAFSTFWAEEPLWSIRKAGFFFSYLPLLFVLNALFSEYGEESVQKTVTALVLGSFLASLLGIAQFFAQFLFGVESVFGVWTGVVLPLFLGGEFSAEVARFPSLLANIGGNTVLRASAFFPDPHMFSYYMGMNIPLAVSLAAVSRGKTGRRLFLIAAGSLFLADLLSFSRGGYVGLFFGALATAWYFRKRSFVSSRRLFFFALIFSLSVPILIIPSPVKDRLLSSFSTDDGSNSGRIAIWSEASGIFARSPVYGYGLGNYPLQVKPTAEYREPIYAHNLFLDIALDLGCVGLWLFLAVLFGMGVSFVGRGAPIFIAAFVSLAIFFGHSLFEAPLYSVQIFPLFLLLLSFLSVKNAVIAHHISREPSEESS